MTEVGKLAATRGVTSVMATHNALEGARRHIAAEFNGEIVLAEDLQTF